MPFNPDIVITEPGSSHVLLIVEAKANTSSEQSESSLKRYMWEMSCPLGLLVSPHSILMYRNRFTGYSEDSIHKLGEFPSPSSWSAPGKRNLGVEFEARVQAWLENLGRNIKAPELSQPTRQALSEHVLPIVENGEIHAAGRRIAI
jgi:hypothetical protein